ncbi:hypothetical protein GCM10008983_13550 [Lentibacillus halophilus]|uniref:Uncharacterized protein n=1 Tax=Lentibacillus halophilus TaxID=295065 RepID=A0ABN0Z8H0_9BACI
MTYLLRIGSLILMVSALVACSNGQDTPNTPNGYADLVSNEEGKYNLLIVLNTSGGFENPEFLQEHNQDMGQVINHSYYRGLNEIEENREELDIHSEPYFVFFDTNSIAFQTGRSQEAEKFLVDAIKEQGNNQPE